MAQTLKNTLAFNLAAGASAVVPHGLQLGDGQPLMPDIIYIPSAELLVTANAVALTLTNDGPNAMAGSVLVEAWHTLERAFGNVATLNLPVKPYVVVGGERTASPVTAIVYRPGDPDGSRGNVYVTWAEVYDAILATAGLGMRFLQFDSRFSTHNSAFGPACPIPAGAWNMMDVTWTAIEFYTRVDILAGATFTSLTDIWAQTLFQIVNDGPGPVPMVDPILLMTGPVRILNSHAGAGPLVSSPVFAVVALNDGGPVIGQLPVAQPMPAPVIDVAGGFCLQGLGSGWVTDNAITDSVGGGLMVWRIRDDSAMGGEDNFQNYDFPGLIAGGGTLSLGVGHRDRHKVSGVIAAGPYLAKYNEAVRVNTAGAPVTINLPRANPALGERVVVKDVGGNAAVNAITVAATGGDTVEGAASITINTNRGVAALVCDGVGNWMRIN